MTSDPSSPTSTSDTEACQLYLSGDLSPAQTAAFEQRLEKSPELADQLFRQSQLLCHVALSTNTHIANPEILRVETETSSNHLLKTLLAIAACLALITTLWVSKSAQNKTEVASVTTPDVELPHEDLLIAEAWATTDAEIHFLNADVELESDFHSDAFPNTSLDDTSLSWVSAAIESGASADG